jgi:hypothetical protein
MITSGVPTVVYLDSFSLAQQHHVTGFESKLDAAVKPPLA